MAKSLSKKKISFYPRKLEFLICSIYQIKNIKLFLSRRVIAISEDGNIAKMDLLLPINLIIKKNSFNTISHQKSIAWRGMKLIKLFFVVKKTVTSTSGTLKQTLKSPYVR
jgi:hypothetical protein